MARIKPTNEYFIDKAKKVHKDKFDYSLVEYRGSHTKVKIKCPSGHLFEQLPMDHWRGSGCKFCAQQRIGDKARYSLNKVKALLHNKYGRKYSFDFTEYVNLESKVKCICSRHGIKLIRVSSLLRGYECTECKGTRRSNIDLEYFTNKSRDVHGNYYDYSKCEITKTSEKVLIVCPKHGGFKQTPNAHMQGQGCPVCKFSKGELRIRKWLVENKVNFVTQHRFDCLKKYSFDFYLPNLNMCIEYDGEYHFHSYERVGGKDGLEKRKKRDAVKNLFCQKSNITLIRIPYWEFDNIEKTLIKDIEAIEI